MAVEEKFFNERNGIEVAAFDGVDDEENDAHGVTWYECREWSDVSIDRSEVDTIPIEGFGKWVGSNAEDEDSRGMARGIYLAGNAKCLTGIEKARFYGNN